MTFALGTSVFDPQSLLNGFGTWALVAVLVIVFIECGLFIFFLPGDSLLFTAGLLVGTGSIKTPIWLVCLLISAAAMGGNLVGYGIGRKVGPRLFHRPDSRFFRPEYIERTHAFFEKYGGRAIVLARFVPIVRTFITAMAGVGRMDFKVYAGYTVLGGLLWGTGLTLLGYWLGNVAFIRNNIEFIAIGIVALSVVPIAVEMLRARRATAT